MHGNLHVQAVSVRALGSALPGWQLCAPAAFPTYICLCNGRLCLQMVAELLPEKE